MRKRMLNFKLVIIISLFSFVIALFVGYSEGINYNLPFLTIEDEREKTKLLEFIDKSASHTFLTKFTRDRQEKILGIWDLKKETDQNIKTNSLIQNTKKVIDKIGYVIIYTLNNDTIKISMNYETTKQKSETEFYFKDNNLVLQNIRWLDSPQTVFDQQVSSFMYKDTLLYVARKPNHCVLIDGKEDYAIIEVQRIKKFLKMILANAK